MLLYNSLFIIMSDRRAVDGMKIMPLLELIDKLWAEVMVGLHVPR